MWEHDVTDEPKCHFFFFKAAVELTHCGNSVFLRLIISPNWQLNTVFNNICREIHLLLVNKWFCREIIFKNNRKLII